MLSPEEKEMLRQKGLAINKNNPPQVYQSNIDNNQPIVDNRKISDVYTTFSQDSKIDPQYYTGDIFKDAGKPSKYDEGVPLRDVYTPGGIEEHRAQEQSIGRRVVNGLTRLPLTTVTKLMEGIGYVGGAIGWAATGDVTQMTENAWSKYWFGIEEAIKEDIAPIYTPRNVTEGGYLDHLGSTSFWMDQGIDAAAFFAAFMIPSTPIIRGTTALAKGLGMSKSAAKLFSGAVLAGTQAVAESGTEAAHFGKELDHEIDAKVKVKEQSIQQDLERIQNQLAEEYLKDLSNLPIGIEGGNFIEIPGVGVKSERELAEESLQSQYKQTFESYAQKRKQELEAYKQSLLEQKATAQRDVFLTNLGILIGPNIIMNKMIFGKLADDAYDISKRMVDPKTLEYLGTARQLSRKEILGNYLKNTGKGIASEGFFEEGLQESTTSYFRAKTLGETNDPFVQGLVNSYVETLGKTEGQLAITLGGLLGSVGGVVGTIRSNKGESETIKRFNDIIAKHPNIAESLLPSTELGMKLDGSPQSIAKFLQVFEKMQKISKVNENSTFSDIAKLAENQELVDFIHDDVVFNFMYPYLTFEGGLDALNLRIDNMKEAEFNEAKEKGKNLTEQNLEQFKAELKAKAKVFETVIKKIDNNYGAWLANIKNETGLEGDKFLQQKAAFLSDVSFAQAQLLSNQEFFINHREKLERELSTLEGKSTKTEADTKDIERIKKNIEGATKVIETLDNEFKTITNNKNLQEAFNSRVKTVEKIEGDLKDAINNAPVNEEAAKASTEEMGNLFKQLTEIEEVTDEQGNKLSKKHQGTVTVNYETVDENGNKVIKSIEGEFTADRVTDKGSIELTNTTDKSKRYLNYKGIDANGNPIYTIDTSKTSYTVSDIIQTSTPQEAKLKLQRATYGRMKQSIINSLNTKLIEAQASLTRLDAFRDYLLEKTRLIVKQINKSGKVFIKVDNDKVKEAVLRTFPDKTISGAKIALTLVELDLLLDEVNKMESSVQEIINSVTEEKNKVQAEISNFNPEDYIKSLEDINRIEKESIKALAEANHSKTVIGRIIKSLERSLGWSLTRITNLKKEIELLKKDKSSKLAEYLDDVEDLYVNGTPTKVVNIELGALEAVREISKRIENLERLLSKQEKLVEDKKLKLEIKDSELQDLEDQIKELESSFNVLNIQFDIISDLIKDFQREYYKNFQVVEKIKIAEAPKGVEEDTSGNTEVRIKESLTNTQIEPRQPFTDSYTDFMRTSVDEMSMTMGNVVGGNISQLLFQRFIDNYKRVDKSDPSYRELRAMNLQLLLSTFGEHLNQRQKDLLTSKDGDFDHSKSVFVVVVKEDGTPELIDNPLNPGNNTILYATMRSPIDKEGNIRIQGKGGFDFVDPATYKETNLGDLQAEVNRNSLEKLSGENLDKAVNELIKNKINKRALEYYDKYYKPWLDSTEPTILYIQGKNYGKVLNSTTLQEGVSVAEDISSAPVSETISNKSDFSDVKIIIGTGTETTTTEGKFKTEPGFVYFLYQGRLVKADRVTLSEEDAERVFRLIQARASETVMGKGNELEAAINEVIYTHYSEARQKTKPNEFTFTLHKQGVKITAIQIGNTTIPVDKINDKKDEIIKFLRTKYYNVINNSEGLIDTKEYVVKDIINGELEETKTFSEENGGYLAYLLNKDNPKLLVKLNKKQAPYSKESIYSPQFINRSFNITTQNNQPVDNKNENVGYEKSEPKEIKRGDKIDVERIKAAVKKGRELREEIESSTETSSTEQITQEPEIDSSDFTGGLKVKAFESIQPSVSETQEEFHFDMKQSYVTEDRGTITSQEIEEFRKQFPDTPIRITKNLPKGVVARFVSSKEQAYILLSPDAPAGATYHEAFHEVIELFTTPEESKALYDEARERLGDTKIVLDGITIVGREMTDAQANEFLAEEYRHVRLVGMDNYVFANNTKVQKTIFRRLWDILTQYLFGTSDKFLIEKKLKEISYGKYELTNALQRPNIVKNKVADYNTEISSIMVSTLNRDFFAAIFNSGDDIEVKNSLENSNDFDKLSERLYNAIHKHYTKQAFSLKESFNSIERTKALVYANMLSNWSEVINSHKKMLRSHRVETKDLEDLREESEAATIGTQIIESNKVDRSVGMPTELKMLLLSLPKSAMVNGQRVNKVNSKYGVFESESFSKVNGILMKNLSNLSTYPEMIREVRRLSNKMPELTILLARLEEKSEFGARLRSQFYYQYNNAQYEYLTAVRNNEGNIYIIDSLSNTEQQRVLDIWKNNLKSKLKANTSVYELKDGRVRIKPGIFKFSFNDKGKVREVSLDISKLKDSIDITNATKADVKTKSEVLKQFVTLFGVELGEDYGKENPVEDQILTNFVSYSLLELNKRFASNQDVFIEEIFDRNEFANNKALKAMSKYVAAKSENFINNVIIVGGKSEYSITMKHKLARITDKLNSRNFGELTPFSKDNLEGNLGTYGSKWIFRLNRSDDTHIAVSVLRNFGDEVGDKIETSELKPGDFALFEFIGVLNGKIPALRAGTRQMEYGFDLGKSYVDFKNTFTTNTLNILNNTFFRDLEKYLKAEIVKALGERNSKITKHFVKSGKSVGLDVFSDLMPNLNVYLKKLKEQVAPENYISKAEELMKSFNSEINSGLNNFIKFHNQKTLDRLEELHIITKTTNNGKTVYKNYGIPLDLMRLANPNEKHIFGDTEYSSEFIEKFVSIFNRFYTTGMIEQSKLMLGEFKVLDKVKGNKVTNEMNKRAESDTSTATWARNDEGIISDLNDYYKRADGKESTTFFRAFTYEDVVVQAIPELYKVIQEQSGEDAKPYLEQEEDNAFTVATLDGYRELALRSKGQWSKEQEKTWQYQSQLFYWKLKQAGIISETVYSKILKQRFAEHNKEADISGKFYYKGNEINHSELIALPVLKPLSVGVISKAIGPKGKITDISALNKHQSMKTAVSLLLPSDINNEEMLKWVYDAMSNGLDFITQRQSRKKEILGNEKGELAPRYDEKGNFNKIGGLLDQGYLIEGLDWNTIGNQLDIDPQGHTTATRSTQMDNLFGVDKMDELVHPEHKARVEEFHKLKGEISEREFGKLVEDLGLEETDGSDYELVNNDAFMDVIMEDFERRMLPENSIEAIKVIISQANKLFDAAPTKRQITNALYAIVRNRSIILKAPGDMLVQQPSTGFEDGPRPDTKVSNFLRFYRPVDEKGDIVSLDKAVRITPAEAMISLPRNLRPFVENNYEGHTFEDKLSQFNKDILNPKWEYYKEFKQYRTYVNNRIPTGHINSIEVFEIVRFLSPLGGPRIVVPTEIVTKAGSDFDVDKLTAYFNNAKINKKGVPIYTEYLTDENSVTEKRYNSYLRGNVSEYNQLLDEVKKDSAEYKQVQQELEENFQKYLSTLKELREELIIPIKDRLNEISSLINQKKEASQEIFNLGYEIFKILPPSLRKTFYDLNDLLDKQIEEGSIQSFEKTTYFKQKAENLLSSLEDNKLLSIEYEDIKGRKIIDKVNTNESKLILKNLIANYDLYLNSIGWTNEVRTEFNNLLSKKKEGYEEYSEAKDNNKELYLKGELNKNTFEAFNKAFNETLAEVFKLYSLEEFSKLSIEKQNTKRAIENRMNELIKETMLSKDNYRALITPTSSKVFKDKAEAVRKQQGRDISKKKHELVGFSHNQEVGIALWNSLQQVGMGAVSTVFHAKTQLNNIRLQDVFFHFLNDFEGVELSLGHITDKDGKIISQTKSGHLQSAVDVAKEDDPALNVLNISTGTFNIFSLLNTVGSKEPGKEPSGFNSIIDFINLPIIREFERLTSIYEAKFLEGTNAELKKPALIKLASKSMGYDFNNDKYRMLHEVIRNYTKAQDKTALREELLEKKDYISNLLKDNKTSPEVRQFLNLEIYLYYKEVAKTLNLLQKVSRYDAGMPKDHKGVIIKMRRLERLKNTGIFVNEDIDKMLSNSFLKQMKDAQEESIELFRQFFTTNKSDELYEFLYGENGIIELYDSVELSKSEDDVERIITKFEEGLVTYLLHNTSVNNEVLSKKYKEMFTGDNSIAKRLENAKNTLNEKGITNMAIEELIGIINEYDYNRNRNIGIDYVKMFNRKLNVEEQNTLTDAIRELRDMPQAKQLVDDLVDFAILQSGVTVTPHSFNHILPSELYTKKIMSILNEYFERPNMTPQQIGLMRRELYGNLAYDNLIVPKENTYYEYKDKNTGKIVKASKLTNSGQNLEVSDRSQNVIYPYLKTYELAPGYSKQDAERLIVQGKRIPVIPTLWEKTTRIIPKESKTTGLKFNLIVYQKVPMRGVPNKFFEISPDGESIVSYNNQGKDVPLVNTQPTTQPAQDASKNIIFTESKSEGYQQRTMENASADATIALAIDFNSAGEKLTKSSVLKQNKKYIPLDINNLDITPERVTKIVEMLNSVNAKTLNIAGNGIYTMKSKYTQEQLDNFAYELLKEVINSPFLNNPIKGIRTGGQTGIDEAGAKAGIRLGIPTLIHAPKGWKFRDAQGKDILSESAFKARFNTQQSIQNLQPKELYDNSVTPINIYSTDKNGFEKLSNIHNGPVEAVVEGKKVTFKTVEHLYQVKKALFIGDKTTAGKIFNANTGWDAQRLSRTLTMIPEQSKAWDKISYNELRSAVELAFEQNENARNLLLSTGKAQLTHKTSKFNLGRWETDFPNILMEIRSKYQSSELMQIESKETRPVDPELDNLIEDFFKDFGFTVNPADEIYFNGELVDAAAKIDLIKKTVDVVQGKAKIDTLPEEAAHLHIALIKGTPLYNSMFRHITNYPVYYKVVNDYAELYNHNEVRLKEEAMSKVIASEIVGLYKEGLTKEQKEQAKGWWNKLWNMIKDLFNFDKNNYREAAYNILNKKFNDITGKNIGSIIETNVENLQLSQNILNNSTQYQLPQGREQEEYVATEKTIRDLAARMSDRIGIPVKFESDRTKEYKGKLKNDAAVINLAYATLDTPIHEILGHPIIRAIKNKQTVSKRFLANFNEKFFNNQDEKIDTDKTITHEGYNYQVYKLKKYSNIEYYAYNFDRNEQIELSEKEYNDIVNESQLYQNLLKELEYGKGKEVLDRIKRDYDNKDFDIIENLIGSDIFKNKINELNKELQNIPNFPNIEDFKIVKSSILKSTFDLSINGKSLGSIRQDVGYFYWNRPSGSIVKIGKSSNVNDAFRKVILKTLQKEFNLKYNISELKTNISKYSEKITVVKNAGNTSKGLYYLTNESGDDLGNYSLEKLKTLIGEENLPKYTLEEQQEEAIVELLGLYTADRLDKVKDGKLISLLKRLLKEMKAFMKSLIGQREVEIDKLPDNMTLGDIADLLAYSNSKLILPGNEVVYTTPDNQQFKTYAEASKHISDLAKSVEDVNLDNVNLNYDKSIPNEFILSTEHSWEFPHVESLKYYKLNNKWYEEFYIDNELVETKEITYKEAEKAFFKDPLIFRNNIGHIQQFIERNKEYEQSKEIIEEWKKVNNIQYNPEEVYSRGQEFVSVVGAYSDFDVNLMMQNLLQHIEDNQKAGGEFTISAFTKPIDRIIPHMDGGGGKIRFKIYPQPEDIKWAANTDVYSGSVWDASQKVSKDKQSELLGVSYTKYPSLGNVNAIQPNLASIIDNLAHHHNELGISLTGSNFRLDYDDNIPYSTKKIIDSINSILDQKYGKLVKPKIKRDFKDSNKYSVNYYQTGMSLGVFNTREEAQIFIDKKEYEDIDSVYIETISDKKPLSAKEDIDNIKNRLINTRYDLDLKDYEQSSKGIIPPNYSSYTNLEGKLKEKIKVFALNVGNTVNEVGMWQNEDYYDVVKNYIVGEEQNKHGVKFWILNNEFKQEALKFYKKPKDQKEYTSQAIINTKIAKLKEVAKKYPRSLIRSEVKSINYNPLEEHDFGQDLAFQKLSNDQKRRLSVQDDVREAQIREQRRVEDNLRMEQIEKNKAEIDKVRPVETKEPTRDLDYYQGDVVLMEQEQAWDNLFNQYSFLTKEQQNIVKEDINNGDLTISCKL